MTAPDNAGDLRSRLIGAGLDELRERGYQDFSVRRVANACGVSCAAPYKHFKNKPTFAAAIIGHINELWRERQLAVLARCDGGTRERIIEISLEYVRFLVDNPSFRSIITLRDDALDEVAPELRGRVSGITAELVADYCREVNMPENVRRRKLYVVRSLIYGAALMFENRELEYGDESMGYVAYSIGREFETD